MDRFLILIKLGVVAIVANVARDLFEEKPIVVNNYNSSDSDDEKGLSLVGSEEQN